MPVGETLIGTLLPVKGVDIGVAEAGIKYANRRDLVVFRFQAETVTAGVFTKNAFCAAPVQICRRHLEITANQEYLLINTGNANAGTGERGYQDAVDSCHVLAEKAGTEPAKVLPFSTGVIGEHLPMERIHAGIELALNDLKTDNWLNAAHGILTTDTVPKGISRQFEFEGQTITLTGISKGSGMICPNMATMLSFVATDAPVTQEVLHRLLQETTDKSFNSITVDSDTSTNDSSILAATGQAPVSRCDSTGHPLYPVLKTHLMDVMKHLATAIIRDGEGATKFVTIQVEQAKSEQEARQVGYTIAHSPLVKTALYASDANWGRILAAVGRAGIEDLDVGNIDILINGVLIAARGGRAESYTEEAGSAAMAETEITISVVLRRGTEQVSIFTSDLSHDYVSINADYRS